MAAKITDINTLLAIGMDPKTGLPIRDIAPGQQYKAGIKATLTLMDEQDAVNRYKWSGLPKGLYQELIERILYYRGQGVLFRMSVGDGSDTGEDTFYFLPYALSGTIDMYGRFMKVTPLAFNGATNVGGDDEGGKKFLGDLKLDVVYDVVPEDELTEEIFENSGVILYDFARAVSENPVPRWRINDPIIDIMAEAYPFARTNLLANSGIKSIRVSSQDDVESVNEASVTVYDHALSGNPYVAVTGNMQMEDMTTNGTLMKTEEYLAYMQSIDNFRLSLYGLDSGGIFEKKAHMLESENRAMSTNKALIYQDGLAIRQRFSDIANSIWGTSIWCEPSESVIGNPGAEEPMMDQEQRRAEQPAQEGGQDDANI